MKFMTHEEYEAKYPLSSRPEYILVDKGHMGSHRVVRKDGLTIPFEPLRHPNGKLYSEMGNGVR